MATAPASLFILAVIHLADYGSTTPDRYEPIYAYDTLAECWAAASATATSELYADGHEVIVVCLPETGATIVGGPDFFHASTSTKGR